MPKVKAFEQRIKDINANCNVISICERFSADNTYVLDMGWDMVVDAIDSFADKVELICLAKQKGLDIITGRTCIDWKRIFFGAGIWGILTLIATALQLLSIPSSELVFRFEAKDFFYTRPDFIGLVPSPGLF